MARINNLSNFLSDVADSIRRKKNTENKISPEDFDTEIDSIQTGGVTQTKSVNIIENGTTVVLPDENYDALDEVDIVVNVPTPQPALQNKNVNIIQNGNTEVEADDGYDGLNKVNINVNVPSEEPSLQSKDITITTNGTTRVEPDSQYDGLSDVDITVNIPQPSGTINIVENGTVNVTDYASANVNVPQLDTSDADAEAINIRKDRTAYVNGQKITGTLPVLTYPSGDFDSQFIAGDSAYTKNRDNKDYLVGTYQVASGSQPDSWMFEGNRKMKLGIPYSLVSNKLGITANKIKQGETIAGVSGNVVPVNNESTRTINPTTSAQDITPASGYTGLSKVTVNPVTSSIDNNISAENIKDGVTILGVEGTYTGGGGNTNINTEFTDNRNKITTNIISLPAITLPSSFNSLASFFYQCRSLKTSPQLINTSNVTTTQNMFSFCDDLETVTLFDTSNVTSMNSMFNGCYMLKDIPLFDTSKVTNLAYMFSGNYYMTQTSLENILQMCINATSYTGVKNLSTLGFSGSSARARFTSCSNYQDFLNAGWTNS